MGSFIVKPSRRSSSSSTNDTTIEEVNTNDSSSKSKKKSKKNKTITNSTKNSTTIQSSRLSSRNSFLGSGYGNLDDYVKDSLRRSDGLMNCENAKITTEILHWIGKEHQQQTKYVGKTTTKITKRKTNTKKKTTQFLSIILLVCCAKFLLFLSVDLFFFGFICLFIFQFPFHFLLIV